MEEKVSLSETSDKNGNVKLYLLSSSRPSSKKGHQTTSEISLLLWTTITNLLLIISLALAFRSEDTEFIKTACIILPLIAIAANILDYKSILPTLNIWQKLNGHQSSTAPAEPNTSKVARYLPIAGMAIWGAVLFI
jgi:hypothetical protein